MHFILVGFGCLALYMHHHMTTVAEEAWVDIKRDKPGSYYSYTNILSSREDSAMGLDCGFLCPIHDSFQLVSWS
jgi:hypothetical protein